MSELPIVPNSEHELMTPTHALEQNNPSIENLQTPDSQSWIRRHKTGLGLAAFAVAGAISLTQSEDIKDDLKEVGKWVAPSIAATEAVAWTGGGLMILAAGGRVGNPLTIKPRLKEVAHELVGHRYYQRGWNMAALGSIGTSTIVCTAAATSLPKESWPLALVVAGASLGFSSLTLPRGQKTTSKESA